MSQRVVTTEEIHTAADGTITRTIRTVTTTEKVTKDFDRDFGQMKISKHSSTTTNHKTLTSPQSTSSSHTCFPKEKNICIVNKAHPVSVAKEPAHATKEVHKAPGKIIRPPKHGSVDDSSSSTDDEEDFAEFSLKAHNKYRIKHGVAPLKLDKSLCKYSKEWVKKCVQEENLRHRTDHKYGENIFMMWSSDPKFDVKGDAPVENWYSEIKNHKFGQEPRSMNTGHFTQVVWKESRELGIAKGRTKSGKIFVVANYNPPGNFIGKYTENVPAPK